MKMKSNVGSNDNRGVSPFIASVLTILFGVLMLTIVLGVVNPIFKRVEDSSVITDAFQNLNLLNSVIKEVSSEAEGSKRTVSVSVSDGEYSINTTTDLLVFTYDPSEDMYLTGRKGDIYIERGSVFLDFFNWYVEDSKADPVWTNTSGQWIIDNYKYKGDGGLAYHNLSTLENYKFSGDIYNSSGGTGGQIFMLPANPERLVGFWPFDNRTGSKAYDWSGTGNNGTLEASSDFPSVGNSTSGWQSSSDCKAGLSCLMFDGVNDFVEVADSSSLNFSEITVALWIKPSSDVRAGLVVKENTFYVLRTWTKKIGGAVRLGALTTYIYSSENAAPSDVWTHAAFTYNGSGQRIYINGVESNSDSVTGAIYNSTEAVTIGNNTVEFFNGTIDEVKIWNVSLSSDEIAAEYELSAKKIIESGSQSVGTKTPNAAIVLANPDGVTSFDNIKVSRTQKEQKLVIPYSKVDLNGTLRIVKGEHRVAVEHMGTNTTLNEPIIQITS